MRMLVESFKRLYESGELTREQIAERVVTGKIDAAEFQCITRESYTES